MVVLEICAEWLNTVIQYPCFPVFQVRTSAPPILSLDVWPTVVYRCPTVLYRCPTVVYRCPTVLYRWPAVVYRCPTVMYRCPTVLYRCPAVLYRCPTVLYRCPAVLYRYRCVQVSYCTVQVNLYLFTHVVCCLSSSRDLLVGVQSLRQLSDILMSIDKIVEVRDQPTS